MPELVRSMLIGERTQLVRYLLSRVQTQVLAHARLDTPRTSSGWFLAVAAVQRLR